MPVGDASRRSRTHAEQPNEQVNPDADEEPEELEKLEEDGSGVEDAVVADWEFGVFVGSSPSSSHPNTQPLPPPPPPPPPVGGGMGGGGGGGDGNPGGRMGRAQIGAPDA